MIRWLLCLLLLTSYSGGEVPLPLLLEGFLSGSIEKYDESEGEEVPSGKVAYLTVDDGPSEAVTVRILDILRDEGIKATFFVLPYEGMDHIYERILSEGHAMGNHSYSHDYRRLYGADEGAFFREDILRMEGYLRERFGYETDLFRFPGGSASWSPRTIARRVEILEELGYRHFDWDASTGDTDPSPAGRDPNALVSNVMARTSSRDKLIVLMHDSAGKSATAEALPEMISRLRAEGYGFDTLDNY